jgi:hypothetical protein
MTVAAYRRGMLAADTCYTEISDGRPEYRVRGTKISIVRCPEFDLAIVTAGDDGLTETYEAAVRQAFTELTVMESDPKLPKDFRLLFEPPMAECLSSIVMYRIGNRSGAYSGENILRRVPVDGYVAIGADASIALGAMYTGANPIAAVQAAVYHGVMSAAPIESVDSTFFEVRKEPTCM